MKDLNNTYILIPEKGFSVNIILIVKSFLFSIMQNIFEIILK